MSGLIGGGGSSGEVQPQGQHQGYRHGVMTRQYLQWTRSTRPQKPLTARLRLCSIRVVAMVGARTQVEPCSGVNGRGFLMSVVYSADAHQANAPAGKPGDNVIPFSNKNRPDPKDVLLMYNEAKTLKSPYEGDFRMCAAFALPRHYSGWGSDGPTITAPNTGAKRYAYDSTCARALPKFSAIMRRLATPDGHRWEKLQASDPYLRKSYRVRAYFDELNDVLFKLRYDPRATFSQSVDEMYTGLGCYGTAPVRFGWRNPKVTDRRGGFGYKAMPLKDMFFLANADGVIDTGFARMFMTAKQFQRKYPQWTPTRSIAVELQKPNPSNTTFFEVVHCVFPRDGTTYDPDSITVQRHPYCSHVIVVQDGEYVGPEGGYRNFPYLVPRTANRAG